MARFRSLDAEMRVAPELKGLSANALLALTRVVQAVDDDGRADGDPDAVVTALFPGTLPKGWSKRTILKALDELIEPHVIIRYTRRGRAVIALPFFKYAFSWQYQSIPRRLNSTLPEPPVKLPEATRKTGNAPKPLGDEAYVKFRDSLKRVSEQFLLEGGTESLLSEGGIAPHAEDGAQSLSAPSPPTAVRAEIQAKLGRKLA